MLVPFFGKSIYRLTYPKLTPVVVAGTYTEPNVLAVSWHTHLSFDPPLYGISIAQERYTYKLIKKYGDFSVNFLPYEMSELIWKVGNVSGRNINKFEVFKIKKKRAQRIKAPVIPDSIAALECKVRKEIGVGDHVFIIGQIVFVWYNKEYFVNGILDNKKVSHAYYLGKGKFIDISKGEPKSFQ